jgi:hypothetical protein
MDVLGPDPAHVGLGPPQLILHCRQPVPDLRGKVHRDEESHLDLIANVE